MAGEATMARIDNDRMIVRGEQRADTTWLFTICYTACFSQSDIGLRFDDSVTIGEVHSAGQPAYARPVAFTATGPKVFRKKRIVLLDHIFGDTIGGDSVGEGSVDRDGRHEAVCAWIRLHRATADAEAVDDEQRSPVLIPVARSGRGDDRVDGLRQAQAQSLRC
jgi:hypothetical protein